VSSRERPAASTLEADRKAIYEWARGDATLLSARCAKAEEALEAMRALLLNIEGGLLGYWTDVPQSVIQDWLPRIRDELGDYAPSAAYTPRDLAEQTLDHTLPYEESWYENARNVVKLVTAAERVLDAFAQTGMEPESEHFKALVALREAI
jgi:hypothetical protein